MLFKKNQYFNWIDNSFILSKVQKKILIRLNLFINKEKECKFISNMCILSYLIFEFLSVIYNLSSNELWYFKLLNIISAFIIPLMIGKTIIDFRYKKVLKDAPMALDEFQHWLFRTMKIQDAIKNTSLSLQGSIQKPFQTLYYNFSSNPNKALSVFKKTFSNEYMDTFANLLKIYVKNGGSTENLAYRITLISTNMRSETMFNSKMQERFIKFKVGCLLMIGATLAMKKYIYEMIPDMGMYDLAINSSQFVFPIFYFIALFFIIDLSELI